MLKRDWEVIERQAAKATDNDVQTYDKLIHFLESPVKNNLDRDVYMTRGLLYWLKCNAHQSNVNGKDSPLTLAAKMFSGKLAYADAFTTLCQKANIHCQTVEGVSKTGDYQPGDLEVDKDKMKAYWNKVFLVGKWWPIHPRWVLRSVKTTASSSGYEGNNSDLGKRKPERGEGVTTEYTFNDFWFLTPPEIFINKCYPDDPVDQLLPSSKLVKRPRQFMKLPYMTPLFFAFGLKLTSEESCIVNTIDGIDRISFKTDKEKSKLLQCDYTLSVETRDEQGKTKLNDLEKKYDSRKIVFCSRKKGCCVFEVRCPLVANYQFIISGGLPGEVRKILLKTKIVCREAMPDLRTLPLDAGTLGWGFSPVTHAAGLSKPTVKTPKHFVEPYSSGKRNTTVIRFRMDNSANKLYKAELLAAGKTSENLKKYVQTRQDQKKQELRMEINVPENGEYALVIKAADSKSGTKDQTYEPVCNYLLTSLETEEKVVDEYFDSSDGTSDIDEEIEQLQKKLRDVTEKRSKRGIKHPQ